MEDNHLMFTTRPLVAAALAIVLGIAVPIVPAVAATIPGAPLMREYGVEHTHTAPGHLSVVSAADGTLLVGNVELRVPSFVVVQPVISLW